MEVPYRMNMDSLSYVSIGYKNSVEIFNNLTGEKKGDYCAKSAYIKALTGVDQAGDWDYQIQMNWLIGNAYYRELVFDEKSKYFYRFVKHAQEIKNKSTLKLNKIEYAPWSFVVMDSSFNYVDEIIFPAKTINFFKYFSNSEVLHFLSMDSHNNSPKDSTLHFKKLQIL